MGDIVSLKEKLHKSKSSLAVIDGYLQILNSTNSSSDEKFRLIIKKARRSCKELQSLIEDMEQEHTLS